MQETRVALPRREYGLDVVCLVLERYGRGRVSLPDLRRLLVEKYGVRISLSHVGNLLRLGLALVHARDVGSDHLKSRLRDQGGIILSCDAVRFDEVSWPLYVLRDVLSGEFLVGERLDLRGAEQVIPLFERVRALEVPVLGVISDKEAAFVKAAAEVFPGSPHQICQVHYLMNLAKPMDYYQNHVGRGVRTVVREVRDIEKSVLKLDSREGGEAVNEERIVVKKLCRVVHSAGKTRGDSLLDPTPLKRFKRLEDVAEATRKAHARPGGPWPLVTKLLAAFALLGSYREQAAFLKRQVEVLRDIARILAMTASGEIVKASLRAYLDGLRDRLTDDDHESNWSKFVDHVHGVSQRFWTGLFHCYDHAELPSNNNAMERFFGALKQFARRVTGRGKTSGGPLETCPEFFVEAFSLFLNSKDPELLWLLQGVPEEELQRALEEFQRLAEPAREKRSIARDPNRALAQILADWSGCPPDDG